MEAVTNMRAIADKQCFISGMSGVVTDIKNLCLQELPIYVAIAALFSFIVLEITGTSFVVRSCSCSVSESRSSITWERIFSWVRFRI